MTQDWYQQGDVIIEPASPPEQAELVPPEKRGHVIESSVTTGHAHLIAKPGYVQQLKAGQDRYLVAKRAFTISHEEHKSITLPAGSYRLRGVREYDHFEEEARRVID